MDFLADVAQWLSSPRTPCRGRPRSARPRRTSPPRRIAAWCWSASLRVPERDCLQYMDPTIPRKVLDMVGDTLCCLVHDKNDLTRDDLLNATIFIHGKESEPKVVQIGPRYFLTPGRLAGAAEQTCGAAGEGGSRPALLGLPAGRARWCWSRRCLRSGVGRSCR